MKITDVKIKRVRAPRVRAIAMIELDSSLIINDIMLIDIGQRILVQLPRTAHAVQRGMESVVPLSSALRDEINAAVLRAYRSMCNLPADCK